MNEESGTQKELGSVELYGELSTIGATRFSGIRWEEYLLILPDNKEF